MLTSGCHISVLTRLVTVGSLNTCGWRRLRQDAGFLSLSLVGRKQASFTSFWVVSVRVTREKAHEWIHLLWRKCKNSVSRRLLLYYCAWNTADVSPLLWRKWSAPSLLLAALHLIDATSTLFIYRKRFVMFSFSPQLPQIPAGSPLPSILSLLRRCVSFFNLSPMCILSYIAMATTTFCDNYVDHCEKYRFWN